jgi:hypothetical protein
MAEHSGISVSKKSNESSHRRRRPQAGPSSGLLSIRATIAASSSTTDGKPLISERSPPQFLCPSVQYDSNIPSDSVLIYRPKNSPPQTITGLSASPDGRNIPDKYIQGNDGRWRKAEYTLYGSTLCQVRIGSMKIDVHKFSPRSTSASSGSPCTCCRSTCTPFTT